MREKWAATDHEDTTHGEREKETLFYGKWHVRSVNRRTIAWTVWFLGLLFTVIDSFNHAGSCAHDSVSTPSCHCRSSVGSRCDPFPRCHRLYCFDINYLSLYHILLFYKVDPWKQPVESGWMLSSDVPAASDSARTESTEERLLLGAYDAAGPSRVRNELSVVISLS